MERTFENGGTNAELILPFLGSLGIYPFPGWLTCPAVAGSLLLLHYGAAGVASILLSSPLFVGIGKISYSLYLWHWPIACFARYWNYEHDTPALIVTAGGLSFGAAYLSWRFVEMPVRLNRNFTARRAFISTAWSCVGLAALCLILVQSEGLRTSIHREANRFTAPPRPFLLNFKKFCRAPAFHPPEYPALDPNYVDLMGKPGKPTFCLLGDSHAGALAPGMDQTARKYGQSGLYVSWRMHPFIGESLGERERQLMEWVAAHPDVRDIYLVGRWLKEYNIEGSIPRLGEKGQIALLQLDQTILHRIEADFQRTAEWFIQHGKKVYVFTTVPEYAYGTADIEARSRIIPNPYPVNITRRDYENRQRPIMSILSNLEQKGLITVIPLHSGLFASDHSVCMKPEGNPYYSDGDHLTPEGAIVACEGIAPYLWGKK